MHHKIEEIGEFGLIKTITDKFIDLVPQGWHGIGDDCAVIPYNETQSLVITTDMLIEGVHFLRDKISPRDLGYKSLAVNISDVAAMGACVVGSFLSIALPSTISRSWCDQFFEGYHSHNVPLLGGDTTKSLASIAINVVAIGMADNSSLKFRNMAKVGDKIYVTGCLGDSGAGLRILLENRLSSDSEVDNITKLIAAHNSPRAHRLEGLDLGACHSVHAMMDVSDGIASDLRHIMKSSEVGAVVELSQIPISQGLRIVSSLYDWDPLELAVNAGEDYVLLFTADPSAKFTYHEIGRIVDGDQLMWLENGISKSIDYKGFTHF